MHLRPRETRQAKASNKRAQGDREEEEEVGAKRPKRLRPRTPPVVEKGRVKSKLDSIIMSHLRHQHSDCQAPISVLPPFSLMEPHVCPTSKFEDTVQNTRANLACRVLKMQSQSHPTDRNNLDKKINKHFVHSRFRHMRTCKDDASCFTACSFLGTCQQLVVGTDSGDLRVLDTFSGEAVDYFDSHAHSSAIHSLRTMQPSSGYQPMLLSSARTEVVLWDTVELKSQVTFRNVYDGSFDSR